MKQQNSKTKKTLLSSVIVLIVCIAMLLGTTFAWFTDSVSNTGNRIQAGKLKIDLLMDKTLTGNYVSIAGKDDQGCIFKEAAIAQNSNETLWEPGKTQVVFLAIENKGNLALKYQTHIDVTDNGLAGALEYALFDGATYASFVEAGTTNWTELKALTTQTGSVVAGRTTISTGVLDEIAHNPSVENERDYVALAVHMKEDAGNEYQGKDIIIDVSLAATQMTAEEDGFGSDQYDANAVYPSVPMVLHIKASSDNLAMTGNSTVIDKIDGQSAEGTDTIQIKTQGTGTATVATVSKTVAGDKMKELLPASSADQTKDREMVLSLKIDTTEKSETSITYELKALADLKYTSATSGEIVTENDKQITTAFNDILTGSMYIGENLKNVTFKHSDQTMEKLASAGATPENKAVGGYYYDPATGYATIKASQFSPFTATFDPPAAAVDGQAYYSLAEAIDAISASSGNNKTIYIQRDISNASGLSVNTSKNFTIDFGGHTYTVSNPGAGSTGTTNQAFQLLKGQTITFKNGTINISDSNTEISRIIQNYADLTLENMNFDDTHLVWRPGTDASSVPQKNTVIEADCGNVVIKGNSSIKTTTGRNALAVEYWQSYYPAGTHVTIQGNFNTDGKIRMYSQDTTEDATGSSDLTITSGTFGGIYEDAGTKKITASISGGTFAEKPDEKYIAEGKYAKENADHTWTVTDIPTDKVARIGGTLYDSLQDAIDATAAGNTVVLLKDTAVNYATKSGDPYAQYKANRILVMTSMTIDLNNHTVTCSKDGFQLYGANSVIKNGKIVITNKDSNVYCAVYAAAGATGLKIENVGIDSADAGIKVDGSGSLTSVINDEQHKIICHNYCIQGGNSAFTLNAYCETDYNYTIKGKVNITGGKYINTYTGTDPQYCTVLFLANNHNSTISGGELKGTYAIYGSSMNNGGSEITITGGTIRGKMIVQAFGSTTKQYNGSLTVTGGQYSTTTDGNLVTFNELAHLYKKTGVQIGSKYYKEYMVSQTSPGSGWEETAN